MEHIRSGLNQRDQSFGTDGGRWDSMLGLASDMDSHEYAAHPGVPVLADEVEFMHEGSILRLRR